MYKKVFKVILDTLIALLIFPIFLILTVFFGPIIYLTDRGNIFFVAKRIGKNGTTFNMYKFRSMKINASDIRNEDGTTFNSDDDPRVTKIGKFLRKTSIDEIPQILNILKGEMSFIGPRPDLIDALNKYSTKTKKRLIVKPGITGYSQVKSRNNSSLEQRYIEDIYYVENLNLNLDIYIFILTIYKVIFRKNLYRNN